MKNTPGFTLIELLVAMTIVGILSVIGLSAYLGVQGRARDAQRLDDAKKIITALEQYKSGAGKYPATTGTGACTSSWCKSSTITTPTAPSWLPGIDSSNFINNAVPLDPKNVSCPASGECTLALLYKYKVSAAGDDYCLEIPQENSATGHPYYKSPVTNGSWRLHFGPDGPNSGVCNITPSDT